MPVPALRSSLSRTKIWSASGRALLPWFSHFVRPHMEHGLGIYLYPSLSPLYPRLAAPQLRYELQLLSSYSLQYDTVAPRRAMETTLYSTVLHRTTQFVPKPSFKIYLTIVPVQVIISQEARRLYKNRRFQLKNKNTVKHYTARATLGHILR